MKAAVVHAFGQPPRYDDFPPPPDREAAIRLRVSAAAASPLARSRVAGAHYSSSAAPPFVAGVDGVGLGADGRRRYFFLPAPPYGAMAEEVVVAEAQTVLVPEGLESTVAAAAANSGMSCWVPLTRLAPLRAGESVLVNGATGAAGRMAVQVARHLGAAHVVATGRNPAKLEALEPLGADVRLPLGEADARLRDEVRRWARELRVGVVLDYLWGPSASALLAALGGPNAPRGPDRIRFVQIGAVSGDSIPLPSAPLRSSGVEILGSGIGSSSPDTTVAAIGEFLAALGREHFAVDFERFPLREVERSWGTERDRRRVYSIP